LGRAVRLVRYTPVFEELAVDSDAWQFTLATLERFVQLMAPEIEEELVPKARRKKRPTDQ
jgi:hypothetical protein